MTTEVQAEAVAKAPKRGVGTVIKEAILAGADNETALAKAKAEFPTSATTASTVSWYRNQLRKDGHDVPTARDLKKAAAETQTNLGSKRELGPFLLFRSRPLRDIMKGIMEDAVWPQARSNPPLSCPELSA